MLGIRLLQFMVHALKWLTAMKSFISPQRSQNALLNLNWVQYSNFWDERWQLLNVMRQFGMTSKTYPSQLKSPSGIVHIITWVKFGQHSRMNTAILMRCTGISFRAINGWDIILYLRGNFGLLQQEVQSQRYLLQVRLLQILHSR